jgi:hypothetical protein
MSINGVIFIAFYVLCMFFDAYFRWVSCLSDIFQLLLN